MLCHFKSIFFAMLLCLQPFMSFAAEPKPQQTSSWRNWLGAGSAVVASVSGLFTITNWTLRFFHSRNKDLKQESQAYLDGVRRELQKQFPEASPLEKDIWAYRNIIFPSYVEKVQLCQDAQGKNQGEIIELLQNLMDVHDIKINRKTGEVSEGDVKIAVLGPDYIEDSGVIVGLAKDYFLKRAAKAMAQAEVGPLIGDIDHATKSSRVNSALLARAQQAAKKYDRKSTLSSFAQLPPKLQAFQAQQKKYTNNIEGGKLVGGVAGLAALWCVNPEQWRTNPVNRSK